MSAASAINPDDYIEMVPVAALLPGRLYKMVNNNNLEHPAWMGRFTRLNNFGRPEFEIVQRVGQNNDYITNMFTSGFTFFKIPDQTGGKSKKKKLRKSRKLKRRKSVRR